MTSVRKFGLILFLLAISGGTAEARDVSFIEPGSGGGSATPEEAFKIEPKSEIDIGDSIINIVRRETLFLVNQTAIPIKIENIALSSDSTVSAVITNDDCSKQGTIQPMSRCSIELSITPTGPGAWSIELLLTHNGPGRITRAKIDGKTAGSDGSDRKDHGLFLSKNDVKPIDFGDVTIGEGKVVRSALMVNDSTSPISILSIDVIEADKSLQRLDQGCEPQMDLKPGESCPVTLVWDPTTHGIISTDLIIRHTGPLGFAVIPVRGNAKGGETAESTTGKTAPVDPTAAIPLPSPPTTADVAKEAAKLALPVHAGSLGENAAATGHLHLIGTVGNRAVFLKPDGTTAVAQTGELLDLDGETARVVNVDTKSAAVMLNGKRKEYLMEAVSSLKARAMQLQAEQDAAPSAKQTSSNTPNIMGTTMTGGPVNATNNANVSGSLTGGMAGGGR